MKKSILFICPRSPIPANLGSKIAMASIIDIYLKMGHEVSLLILDDKDKKGSASAQLSARFQLKNIYYFSLPNKWWAIFKALLLNRSMVAERFSSKAAKYCLDTVVNQYDVLHAYSFYTGSYIGKYTSGKKTLVDLSALETLIWKNKYEQACGLKRFFYKNEYKKIMQREVGVVNKVSRAYTQSESEAEYLIAKNCDNVVYRPLYMDLTQFPFVNSAQEDYDNLLFLGDYKWMPNKEAIYYILNKIFPALKEYNQNLTLTILGRNAPADLINLASSIAGVKFIGEVPDTEPYFQKAGYVLAPVLTGGGVRLKILESLARGKIVITNEIGSEGIVDKSVLLIAETPDEINKKMLFLNENKAVREELKKSARKYVADVHSMEKNVSLFEDIVSA